MFVTWSVPTHRIALIGCSIANHFTRHFTCSSSAFIPDPALVTRFHALSCLAPRGCAREWTARKGTSSGISAEYGTLASFSIGGEFVEAVTYVMLTHCDVRIGSNQRVALSERTCNHNNGILWQIFIRYNSIKMTEMKRKLIQDSNVLSYTGKIYVIEWILKFKKAQNSKNLRLNGHTSTCTTIKS